MAQCLMMSVPAAPVTTVVVRVSNAVVDRAEVRAEVSEGVRGGRSAAAMVVPEAGQIGKASGVARC